MSQSKLALVTGGNRGIGLAIVESLRSSNYEVFGPSSSELDLASKSSIDAYCNSVFSPDASLDLLVLNAGVFYSAPLAKHSIEDFERVIDINLTGAFRLIKYWHQRMAKASSIIIISSISSAGELYAPAYSASKAALNAMAKSLAQELYSSDIRVNVIAPGWVRTDMAKSILSDESLERDNLEATLIKRYIEPKEIAAMLLYLVSDSAQAITGEIFTISGGIY